MSALIGGAVIFSIPFVTQNHHILKHFSFAIEPGNSIRPIRSSIVYLVSICMFYITTKVNNKTYRNLLMGLVIGISLLWSNDFALITGLMYSIFCAAFFFIDDRKTFFKNCFTTVLISVATWSCLITLATGGHPIPLLKYNFQDVAQDQWWYFPPYGMNGRICNIIQLYRLIISHAGEYNNVIPCLLMIFYLLKSFFLKDVEDMLIAFIGISLFGGGCIATVGGHISQYFDALHFWSFIVIALLLIKFIYITTFKIIPNANWKKNIDYALFCTTFACVLFGFFGIITKYNSDISFAKTDPKRFYIGEYKGYLGTEWTDYITFIRQHKNNAVVEEYWGLWSSLTRQFSSWPVDSVIHALGNTRNIVQKSLGKSDFVITTKSSVSAEWQHWSLTQNFWFYKKILLNYHPIMFSEKTVVWKKNPQEIKETPASCSIVDNKNIKIENEDSGVFYVKLNYHSHNGGRYILFFRNNISYAADAHGHASLPNKESVVEFPVFLKKGSNTIFDSTIMGNNYHDFYIKSCEAYKMPDIGNSVFNIE
ncbi:hypothetical protein [Acetobacter sp. LMG 32666]|uniref:hypothetical protein n=1 Tax=Acetobacter sp. LMG 32666 TaxID=2959295 RepID=UPI0030C82AB6